MKFIADFHIHSKYSRATSKDMDLDHISENAKLKGIDLLGTGDFTHHLWLAELEGKLQPKSYGIYTYNNANFILTSEVSNIYDKAGKNRRIHIVLIAPSFKLVKEINKALEEYGDLFSDGRPILKLDIKRMAKIIRTICKDCFIIPAHIWTPWFGILGSKTGFDSIEECFEEETDNIYALETGLSCYDEKTEVLTEDGWKKFPDVKYADKICTLNIKTNEIEFQAPTKIYTYEHKGKMYRLKTKRVDLLVTPNHKLLYSHCDFRKSPQFSLKEAQLLFNKSKRFKKDGTWAGKSPDKFILPAVKMKHGSRHYSGFRNKKEKKVPIKSWLKFFGFWIAEGWTNKDKNGDYNVCICNNDKVLLSEIRQILENFGYQVYQRDNVIRVRDYQLFHYLKQFGKCSDKFVPLKIKSLSKEFLEIFLKYYIKGDSHIYKRSGKGLSATTSSIRLRDDLQEIALKVGMSAYYKLHNKKGTPFQSPGYEYKRTYEQKSDSWVIFFIRKNIHTVLPSAIKKYNYTESWIDYDGSVFSVSVPNHVIYIRRNGVPVWCGNSDPPMNWHLSNLDKFTLVSNSDAHSPSKLGREANVFEGKMDYFWIQDVLKEKNKEKFLYTIEFFPQEGKYHYDGHRNCGICLSPEKTQENKGKCPKCGKPLTIGVMNRVKQLGDRPKDVIPEDSIPFKHLIPLNEIIAEVKQMGLNTLTVKREYKRIIQKGRNEFDILINLPFEELVEITGERIAKSIIEIRKENVEIMPGYDGKYGEIKFASTGKEDKQMTLF